MNSATARLAAKTEQDVRWVSVTARDPKPVGESNVILGMTPS